MNRYESLEGRIDAVVIGASAGGVEALTQLLPQLPASSKLTVLVVLHVPRDRPSLLVDIFRPRCRLHVAESQDKDPIQPGTVYFAPPDYHLMVDIGPKIALSADELVNFSRPSIDVLFESAADLYQRRVLGIVLSGGNHDGAAGLQAIVRAGGLAVVQSPEQAAVDIMPRAAIAAGSVDYVLPLDQIAELLAAL